MSAWRSQPAIQLVTPLRAIFPLAVLVHQLCLDYLVILMSYSCWFKPVPGPAGPEETTCYSPCCASAADCAVGALPAGGGGCVDNAGPGPESEFYYTTCYNAYA